MNTRKDQPNTGGGLSVLLVLASLITLGVIGGGVWVGWMLHRTGGGSENGAVPADIDQANDAEAKAAYQAMLDSMKIPEFRALDQDGHPVGRDLFLGHCTILHFAFTHCVTVCPVTTGKMMRIQGAAGLLKGKAKLVSISVDPAHDTPEQLKAHTHDWANYNLWTWVSADPATLKSIVVDSLGFPIEPDAADKITLNDGTSMSNIRHTARLLLLDANARVVGMYSGTDDADVTRLIDAMRHCCATIGSAGEKPQ